jgi:hypothetical protein
LLRLFFLKGGQVDLKQGVSVMLLISGWAEVLFILGETSSERVGEERGKANGFGVGATATVEEIPFNFLVPVLRVH